MNRKQMFEDNFNNLLIKDHITRIDGVYGVEIWMIVRVTSEWWSVYWRISDSGFNNCLLETQNQQEAVRFYKSEVGKYFYEMESNQ